MGRETQLKGDKATSSAIAYFTHEGFDVSVPITESAPYDLLVDDGAKIQRVQVKYSANKKVDLRRIHSNSTGYVVKNYILGDYDWLFVEDSDGVGYLFTEQPSTKHISLRKGAGVWFNGPLLKSEDAAEVSVSSNLTPSASIFNREYVVHSECDHEKGIRKCFY